MTRVRSNLLSITGLLALIIAMFGDVLFAGGTRVLSDPGADLFLQYYHWRDFGFHELAKGNLALWNPYIFGGAPFFGGMQSALLYPLNWLFLVLPLAAGINWTIALNTFALGAFMFCWMRVRGLTAVSAFFAGAIAMFSGPYFLHVFAGHLPQMAAMAWSPLILCAIDGFFESEKTGWCLLGMFAVAMQVLAGFPQYVFYVGIIAAFYAALLLFQHWTWRVAAGLVSIYLGGALLTAVQILPAIQATNETVRGIRVPFQFASQCGFPLENFLTLLAPAFFGKAGSYWGRCYLWETSLFLGATTLVLAIYSIIYAHRKQKWIAFTVIFVALVLALGAHTPLFHFFYAYIPGFDRLRATAKFIFPASLFIVLLAAMAVDHLLKQSANSRFVIALFITAAVLVVAGLWLAQTSSWMSLINLMPATHETYLRPDLFASADFVRQAQHGAASSTFLAAGLLSTTGILLALRSRTKGFIYAVVALGLAEVLWFARVSRPTFDSATIVNPEERAFVTEHPGDYRILNSSNPNSAMSLRVPDIWGYDPNVVRRYAEFVTWTQNGDPDEATLYVKFTHFDPLYPMLRLRYVFAQRNGELLTAESPLSPMPHLQLICTYRVLAGRGQIFEAMRSSFDPTREIILETEPDPRPVAGDDPGTAKIMGQSTDALTIEADLNRPAILLVTDVYTRAWRATPLSQTAQSKYTVLPANYVLRAVPLMAGHHHFRMEYAPSGFAIGKWISIVSGVLFVVACISRKRGAA